MHENSNDSKGPPHPETVIGETAQTGTAEQFDASKDLEDVKQKGDALRQSMVEYIEKRKRGASQIVEKHREELKAQREDSLKNLTAELERLKELHQEGNKKLKNYNSVFLRLERLIEMLRWEYETLGDVEARLSEITENDKKRELQNLYEGYEITIKSIEQAKDSQVTHITDRFSSDEFVLPVDLNLEEIDLNLEEMLASIPFNEVTLHLEKTFDEYLTNLQNEVNNKIATMDELVRKRIKNQERRMRGDINAIHAAFVNFFRNQFSFGLENLTGSQRHLEGNTKLQENLAYAIENQLIEKEWLDKLLAMNTKYFEIIKAFLDEVGVELVDPKIGEDIFEPGIHRALDKGHSEHPINTVMKTASFGLRFKGSEDIEGVIYPATVFVSAGPKPEERPEETEKSVKGDKAQETKMSIEEEETKVSEGFIEEETTGRFSEEKTIAESETPTELLNDTIAEPGQETPSKEDENKQTKDVGEQKDRPVSDEFREEERE